MNEVVIHDEGVAELLNRLIAEGENPEPWLAVIGRVLKSDIQQGFQTGSDPYGRAWAPLKFRDGKPLLDKGHLLGSIGFAVEGDSVVVGTNKAYAGVHQFGATIEAKNAKALRFFVNGGAVIVRKVTIPRREFLPWEGLPDAWAGDIRADLTGYFERPGGRSGA